MSSNLILDGVLFRKDFAENNPGFIKKFIDGALSVADKYGKEFKNIRKMPAFELMSDEDIIEMSKSAKLATWVDNKKLLTGEAALAYEEMSNIWSEIGETAYPNKANEAFDEKYIMALEGSYSGISYQEGKDVKFSPEQREIAKGASNDKALLKQTLAINFEVNSSTILSDSYEQLNDFCKIAKMLNNVMIQIEGNTDSTGNTDSNKLLSESRAKSIALYLKAQGIEVSRLIIVGNGSNNPIADNASEEGRAKNRRTEIFFKAE